MASIKDSMDELKNITEALGNLKIQTKELNDRKKFLTSVLVNYIEKNNIPGLQYKGFQVLPVQKTVRKALPKKIKIENTMKILEEHGVENVTEIYEDILKAGKGESKTTTTLKITAMLKDLDNENE